MSAAFSLDDFVALLRRTTDPGWLDPILADADSSTLLLAMATEFVRLSQTVDQATLAGAISTAPAGRPGVAVLTLSRTSGGTGGAIPSGYGFVDSRGIKMVSSTVTPVPSGATVVTLQVMTLRQTEVVNTEDDDTGVVIDPLSHVILDGLGTSVLIAPPGSAGITSTTFTVVASATQILNGICDYLSLHGRERGQLRQPNETEEGYRLRVRNIPDAVTPAAVATGVQGAATQVGLDGIIIREPFEDGADAALKAALGLDVLETYFLSGVTPAASSPAVDFWDDPYVGLLPTGVALRPRETVSNREGRAYFRIETPSVIKDPDGIRFIWDNGFWDDPVFGFPDVLDNPQVIASLMAIWEEANIKRAAGVQFDVLLPIPHETVGSGHAMAAGATLVVTLNAPFGKAWLLMDFVVGHDAARSGVAPNPSTDSHFVTFTFSDATTFSTAAFAGLADEHLSPAALEAVGFPFKPITTIQGYVGGAGVNDVGLVVDARVIDFTV